MGLYEARGNLNKQYKDLLLKWQFVKQSWDDAQSKAIEEEVLAKLQQDLRAAVEAIDSMSQLCTAARRECSPSVG